MIIGLEVLDSILASVDGYQNEAEAGYAIAPVSSDQLNGGL
jgi:hypothetical protein